jgi:hypothetical protein
MTSRRVFLSHPSSVSRPRDEDASEVGTHDVLLFNFREGLLRKHPQRSSDVDRRAG